jgi:N-acylneuraminate cytidylyltransferase
MKILSVIPARSGSKGIPGKNMKLLNGKPLIQWVIECALSSETSRTLVSTDSEEIADYALSLGAEAPFLRPADLSIDEVPIEPVLRHAYEFYTERLGWRPDALLLLLPTAPFRTWEDINQAIQIFKTGKVSSVFSVTPAEANLNPNWMVTRESNGLIRLCNGKPMEQILLRRQLLPDAYIRNDYVFILDPKNLYDKIPNLYGSIPEILICDADRDDVDINTARDWRIAELLLATGGHSFK